jgi:hypothetical protein
LPPIAIAVKSIPFNKIIRNLDARRRCRVQLLRSPLLLVDNTRPSRHMPALNQSL